MTASLDPELLTTPEAAVVAGVEVRDVNRLIDEHILPPELYSTESTRKIHSAACAFVRFYYGSAEILTATERRHAIDFLYNEAKTQKLTWRIKRWSAAKSNLCYRHKFLTLNFARIIEDTIEEHDKLARAREIVVEDPKILGGTPIIKGTRVPVYDLAAAAAAGLSVSDIREDYPSLSEDNIALAILYAKATPMRGRPKSLSGKGPTISRKSYSRRLA